ncbi:MAG: cyclic nucleotide-binding domain-containing protein [Anaerolineales bacterium]
MDIQHLSEVELFKGLPETFLREILGFCAERNVKNGDVVFNAQDEARYLFVLLEGSVAIRVNLTSRPESVTLSYINRPYSTFGWSGVVSPFHYTATAVCDEDSRLLQIDGHRLMALLEKHPEHGFTVMRRMTEIISNRLRNSHLALLKTL